MELTEHSLINEAVTAPEDPFRTIAFVPRSFDHATPPEERESGARRRSSLTDCRKPVRPKAPTEVEIDLMTPTTRWLVFLFVERGRQYRRFLVLQLFTIE